MRYLGLDLGTKTLGLAISDKTGMIATNLTILRHDEDYNSLLDSLEEIIKEKEVDGLVLGLPKNMNNTMGERALIALKFKDMLEEKFSFTVFMQDERLSTVEAENILLTNDTSRKKRKKVIDSVAATIILQSFLDRKGR